MHWPPTGSSRTMSRGIPPDCRSPSRAGVSAQRAKSRYSWSGMISKALAMCWALLLAGRPGVEAQAPAGCDSEDELLSNLKWLKRSCPHETFADGFTLVPQAITTAECADVARRVASECGWLLGSSDWFESRKAALDAAVVSAAALPDDKHSPAVYALADPSVTTVHTCGATLTDGFKDFAAPSTGQSRMTIDVGPSNGYVRLTLSEGTTLDAKANDNFRVYADAEQRQEVVALYSGDLPLAAPIDVPGSVAGLLLVSDGATRHTSLRATVECVCEDSASFEDAEGDGCAAYGRNFVVVGTKHSRCASPMQPTDEAARAACPLACGACEPDVCASSPCLNGGTCTQGPDSAKCKTSDLADRADALWRESDAMSRRRIAAAASRRAATLGARLCWYRTTSTAGKPCEQSRETERFWRRCRGRCNSARRPRSTSALVLPGTAATTAR